MRYPYALVAIAFGALTTACSSSATDNTDGGTTPTACTIGLTGALAASTTCTAETAFWSTQTNATTFYVNSVDGSSAAVGMLIGFPGQPATGTYRQTDSASNTYITATSGSSAWVAASPGATAGGITLGSFTVTITSVNKTTTSSSGNIYELHGTITATMPAMAGTGTTGTVTLNGAF